MMKSLQSHKLFRALNKSLLTPSSILMSHKFNVTSQKSRLTVHKKSSTTELVSNTKVRGIDILRDPMTNKGTAFTIEERQTMGIHGLLPPCHFNAEEQVYRVMTNFKRFDNDLDRFSYMMSVKDRNEKLFYRVIAENIELMMPIIYTPTVGLACQKYGLIYTAPRGIYITVHDLGHVYEVLCNWPYRDIRAVVVTDGERILGLGDLGAYGMGIPVGKLALYTAIGGFEPRKCLPVCIDAGTNREDLLADPLYIGLRHNRERSEKYFELVDEFCAAVVKKWGQDTLIQFEDFANLNAFTFLEKYQSKYLTFNDDIQGTASVSVAGILAAMRITGNKVSENIFLFQGAGQAATGIAQLLVLAMMREGLSSKEASKRIWMVDIDGLLVRERPLKYDHSSEIHLDRVRAPFVKDHRHISDLHDIVEEIKPSVLFGLSTVKGAFTEKILRKMAEINERPIIFALSNPTSKAECTAEEAYSYTDGRAIFASGSPFKAVKFHGRTFTPGQGNNAYIFPAICLASVLFKAKHIPDEAFLEASVALSNLVRQDNLDSGLLFPPLSDVKEATVHMTAKLGDWFYKNNLAMKYPEPENKLVFVRNSMWSPEYETFMPSTYEWPDHVADHTMAFNV